MIKKSNPTAIHRANKQRDANYRGELGLYRLGVGAMIFNDKGLILSGERRQTNNAWQMPQGGIDADEEPEVALRRELFEEVGITPDHFTIVAQTDDWLHYHLPPAVQKKLWHGKYVGQRQKWFLCQFLGSDDDINIAAQQPPEFVAWNWLTSNDLSSLVVDFKRDLYQQIFRSFIPLMLQKLV